MPGLLETLLAGYSPAVFDQPVVAPVDPLVEADEARDVAARRVRGGVKGRTGDPIEPVLPGLPGGVLPSLIGRSWGQVDAANYPEQDAIDPTTGLPMPKAKYQPPEAPADPWKTPMPVTGLLSNLQASQPAVDLPPSTNDPASSEPVVYSGGVPVPRPRPSGAPGAPAATGSDEVSSASKVVADAAAPMSIAPAAPAPEAPRTNLFGGSNIFGDGMLGKILRPENASLFLSLGGGFAGAPSLGTGMRRAFSGAAPVAMQMQQQQFKMDTMGDIYRSLIARGASPQEALAAARSPEVLKVTAAKYFETKPRQHVTLKDALGADIPATFDPNTGKYYDAEGKPFSTGGSGPGSTGAPQLLAPGVKYNPDLTGDEYLNQYSNDVKAAVKAYMNGDVMPTGNPRMKSINEYAKKIAQRYGQEMGIPVSDSLYGEKRAYRNELGSDRAGTAGGQVKAFNQGIEHAHALTQAIDKLDNSEGLGIPAFARWWNGARQSLSTKQSGKAAEVNNIGQTLAGEVGKLFSGSAGGGVHERELTRQRFDAVKSPTELAAALESTLETMEGGLRALEQSRDRKLGPGNGPEFVTAETRARMDEMRAVIRKLRGERGAAAGAGNTVKIGDTTVPWRVLPQQ